MEAITTNKQTNKHNQRIEYIDALRGLPMILVVFSHVELKCFEFNDYTLINSLFVSFYLPLFFWISGFMGYRASTECNLQTLYQSIKNKALTLLIPTFVFGLAYTFIYLNDDFNAFITHNGKLGYWFLIALLEIFIIVYFASAILYSPNPKKHRKRMLIALIIISGVLFLMKIPLKMHPALNEIGSVLTLHHTFNYFQYFAFGYICTMYKESFSKALENKYCSAIIIVLFAVLFYIKRCNISNLANDGMSIYQMLDIVLEAIIGYLGILLVYNVFRTNQDAFASEKKIGKALQLIGKRTLDIYIIHYFFLSPLPKIANIISNANNNTLELTIVMFISLIVIGLSLIVSSILRTSPLLAKWLFGAKIK